MCVERKQKDFVKPKSPLSYGMELEISQKIQFLDSENMGSNPFIRVKRSDGSCVIRIHGDMGNGQQTLELVTEPMLISEEKLVTENAMILAFFLIVFEKCQDKCLPAEKLEELFNTWKNEQSAESNIKNYEIVIEIKKIPIFKGSNRPPSLQISLGMAFSRVDEFLDVFQALWYKEGEIVNKCKEIEKLLELDSNNGEDTWHQAAVYALSVIQKDNEITSAMKTGYTDPSVKNKWDIMPRSSLIGMGKLWSGNVQKIVKKYVEENSANSKLQDVLKRIEEKPWVWGHAESLKAVKGIGNDDDPQLVFEIRSVNEEVFGFLCQWNKYCKLDAFPNLAGKLNDLELSDSAAVLFIENIPEGFLDGSSDNSSDDIFG